MWRTVWLSCMWQIHIMEFDLPLSWWKWRLILGSSSRIDQPVTWSAPSRCKECGECWVGTAVQLNHLQVGGTDPLMLLQRWVPTRQCPSARPCRQWSSYSFQSYTSCQNLQWHTWSWSPCRLVGTLWWFPTASLSSFIRFWQPYKCWSLPSQVSCTLPVQYHQIRLWSQPRFLRHPSTDCHICGRCAAVPAWLA